MVRGNFAFGSPCRYVQLKPDAAAALASRDDVRRSWDSALNYSTSVFSGRMYSLCGCNCHNFVAHFLEQIRFAGFHSWSIIYLVRAQVHQIIPFTCAESALLLMPSYSLLCGTCWAHFRLEVFPGPSCMLLHQLEMYEPAHRSS